MSYKKYSHIPVRYLFWAICLIATQGCTRDESPEPTEDIVSVPFEITADQKKLLAASFDATHTVDRVLILPFRKTDESAANDAANFVPEFSAAKQLDINSFPVFATMLNLSTASSYQIMAIGCNRNDYDINDPGKTGTLFTVGPGVAPTLDNLNLQAVSPLAVPEIFVCACNAYQDGVLSGAVFIPQKGITLSGNLIRLVGGLSLDITGIPAFVDSVSLVAEQLVKEIKLSDGTPLLWQTAGDAESKLLGKQKPAAGVVSFNTYLLPTFDAHKTKLYLDIRYAGITERYTVAVNDVPGTSSANSIIFVPNRAVKITGDYADINIGFIINGTINLDDNLWDGI